MVEEDDIPVEPTRLTAKRRSKTLKDHREGFESVNGVGPTPPVDIDAEVSGIIGQLLHEQYLPWKTLNDAAGKITKVTEKKIRFCKARNMICKALGYRDMAQCASSRSTDMTVENLNYGHKSLASLTDEITANDFKQKADIRAFFLPMIELVYSLPDETEYFKTVPKILEKREVYPVLLPFMERHGISFPEDMEHPIGRLATALFIRYPKTAAANVRKDYHRRKGYSTSLVKETLKELEREYNPSFFDRGLHYRTLAKD